MDNRKTIMLRVYLVYGIMLLISLVIFGKILYIQFAQGEMWRQKAKKISLKYFSIEPERGNIMDANGELLATSVPFFELRMDAATPEIADTVFDAHIDSLAICLAAKFSDLTKQQYKRTIVEARKKGNRYLLLKRKITYDELKEVRTFPLFKPGKISSALIALPRSKRVYPFNNLCYRTIGFFKENNDNNVGLESAFNRELQGTRGQRLYQRIAGGNWRPLNKENEIEPESGKDIITTLDIRLQDVAEEALQRQLEFNQADHGCAILMETATGQIKALANLGKAPDGTYQERYNYAIGESTEPGSTFKTFSLLAAFEDGKTDLNQTVNATGGKTTYANRTMSDSHLGAGILTVQQALEKSSNVGVSKIIYKAYGAHPQDFIDRLYSFGVQKPLGLEIPGEGKPLIKSTSARSWSKVSLPWMSIGYEVALTPLQILTFYNAIANNGTMVKPYIVKEIHTAGQPDRVFETKIINKKIAGDKALGMARTMLEGVVEHGTGTALKDAVYRFAGKTGTAQVAQNSGGYNKSSYKGSFVGYFPADKPKYSIIVVINEPSTGGYYGGAIAAPVVREIADRVYASDPESGQQWPDSIMVATSNPFRAGQTHELKSLAAWMGFPPIGTAASPWMSFRADSTGRRAVAQNLVPGKVPDVSGMGMRDAIYLLESVGFKVSAQGRGLVKGQSPAAGAVCSKGTLISINLGMSH